MLPAPVRVAGRRRYDMSVLDRLVIINAARRAKFTLAEVHHLLDGMSNNGAGAAWRALAERKLPEIDELIRNLRATRKMLEEVTRCRCTELKECAAQLRNRQADR